MAHVFISYSSKHKGLTQRLAPVLEAQGYTVWWDHGLESWGDYEIQIRNALNEARAVIVIWIKAAGDSDWVKSEAARASRDGKLINVHPPDTMWHDVPAPYDQHHIDSIEDTNAILRSLASVWVGTPIRTTVPLHELYWRQHGAHLIDPRQRKLTAHAKQISPSELLQAKYAIVPYIDLFGRKSDFLTWCSNSSRSTAGRLVHGSGGLGKTRLMIEVASELRSQGWMAGFLNLPHETTEAIRKQRYQALEQLITHGESGVLIILDYAEGRQDEVKLLANLFARRPEANLSQARLVLLSRGAGQWWSQLVDENPQIATLFGLDQRSADVMSLPPLEAKNQRVDLFFASIAAFSPILELQGIKLPSFPPVISRIERNQARPLAIQMEALLYLYSAAPESELGDVHVLLRRVLGLERDYWRKLFGAPDERRMRDMNRGVAEITAVAGVASSIAAERLLIHDAFYKGKRNAPADVADVLGDLQKAYGDPWGAIAQLEPDLVGEHHVATVSDVHIVDACLTWIDTMPASERSRLRQTLLTVLQRATRPEHGESACAQARALLEYLVTSQLETLAREVLAVIVDTPGALEELLISRIHTSTEPGLEALDAVLPQYSLALMDLSLRIAERREQFAHRHSSSANLGIEREIAESRLASRKGALSLRLTHLGEDERALKAAQENVALRRRQAKMRLWRRTPSLRSQNLAISLNRLSECLVALHRYDEALEVAEEAVQM